MRLWKKLSGALLALVLALSLTPAAGARYAYSYLMYASNAEEIAAMLDGVSKQTFSVISAEEVRSYITYFLYTSSFSAVYGGRFPYTNSQGYWSGKTVTDGVYTQVVSATGCCAYSKFVSQVIYGVSGDRHDLWESAGHITGAGLKAFLQQYAQAGEHLRLDSRHSVTYVSGNDSGFYYMDYAGDQNPRIWLRFTTYEHFAAWCNEQNRRLWLYEADWAENGGEAAAETAPAQPAQWLVSCVEAAEALGLTQNGGAACGSSLTMAEAVTLVARAHSLLTVGGVEFQTQGAEAWYSPYAEYLAQNGILSGEPDYAGTVTRGEFVSLLAAAVPEEMDLGEGGAPIDFADAAQIEDLAAVQLLCRTGVLNGIRSEDGVFFCPGSEITRGEAVALLARLVLPELRAAAQG